MELLILVLLTFFLGYPASYLTRVLLLEEKDSHEGPFKDKTKYVVFRHADAHAQHVALFDWIRRPFGVYQIEHDSRNREVWVVRDHWKAELWTCPVCLSFWTSLTLSIPAGIVLEMPWYAVIVAHLGITSLSTIINTSGD